uniref:Calpain catalytic domain-containing protein n=1 Tax=Pygocentrus nattereri TaxID=42514 RepID=A0AAR2M0A7_PYGNA
FAYYWSQSDLVKFQGQDFQTLRQSYISKQEKFIDEKFPPEMRSIGTGLLSQKETVKVVWKRPSVRQRPALLSFLLMLTETFIFMLGFESYCVMICLIPTSVLSKVSGSK